MREYQDVVCARCQTPGTSATFFIEEGGEWECPSCYEELEAAQIQTDRKYGNEN